MVSYYELYLLNKDDDACDTQFRRELLEFFDLEKYDETKLSIKTDKLYAELIKNVEFNRIFNAVLQEANYKTFCPEAEISSFCIVILLSFDYFYLFKQCYKELKETNGVDSAEILIDKLIEK
tara:strand:- start:935 stop:1300 length:366 start_codon:yes stop_codon:yes gene_type:complete